MLAASRPDHPAPRITLSMPPRRNLAARTHGAAKRKGYKPGSLQFPQADLNQHEIAAERRRDRRQALAAALIATALAILIGTIYWALVKAPENLSTVLAQAEAMRGM